MKIRFSKTALILTAVLLLGILVGILGATSPIVSVSQEHSTLATPVSVGANSYASEILFLTKGETVSFSMRLDNQTLFRLYIMNGSEYHTYYECAPKCMQPLLGGIGSYYKQAGASRPILFLNESVSESIPYSGNFTAPSTDTYHFVFDNSIGKTWNEYLGQNATGFTIGSIETVTFLIAKNYSINWNTVALGAVEVLVCGAVLTTIWELRVKPKRKKVGIFTKRFRTIIAVFVVLAILVIDLPIFVSGLTNSNYFFPYGSGANNQTTTASTSPPSNYSIFEVDSDYLTNVGKGGFGEMSIDSSDQLVFAATKTIDRIYIYHLAIEAESDIGGFNNPQSVLYVPDYGGKLFVSNGGNGTVDILSVNDTEYPATLQRVTELDFSSNTDFLAYDNISGVVYVGIGNGNQSGIGIIDANTDTVLGTIPLNVHPGQFAVEENGSRLFVNLPGSNSIDVIDLLSRSVIDSWPTGNVSGSEGIALDESNSRLFVGYANPPTLRVYDDQSGMAVMSLKLESSPGDVIYDPQSKLVFAACSKGSLEDFIQVNPNSYVLDSSQETGLLGSTAVLYPPFEEVYVAVPQSGYQSSLMVTFEIYQN